MMVMLTKVPLMVSLSRAITSVGELSSTEAVSLTAIGGVPVLSRTLMMSIRVSHKPNSSQNTRQAVSWPMRSPMISIHDEVSVTMILAAAEPFGSQMLTTLTKLPNSSVVSRQYSSRLSSWTLTVCVSFSMICGGTTLIIRMVVSQYPLASQATIHAVSCPVTPP